MLWCAWCAEGLHAYCLDEGEGPLNEAEARDWVCRRCAVCNVCGSGSSSRIGDTLQRCGACRLYYHLHCLGPDQHRACNPPHLSLWVSVVFLLLELKTLLVFFFLAKVKTLFVFFFFIK